MGRLVGRRVELARLGEALAGAAAGAGRLVVVEGPAGIGKSALLDRARTEASACSVRVVHAVGRELESEHPFGVIRRLFQAVVNDATAEQRRAWFRDAAELAAPVFAEQRPTAPGAAASGEDLFARLHGLYWFIVGVADDAPLVVVVDDAHWADEPSLAALGYLGRRLIDIPVSLIVGTRPPDEAPAALRSLLADRPDAVVALAPLGVDDVADVVRSRLGGGFEAVAGPCHDATGGNPFLLQQLLGEVERRRLGPRDAEREVAGLAPDGVMEFLGRRLARLPTDVNEVVRALAVLGDDVGLAVLAGVARLPATRTANAALRLRRDGIVAGDHGTFRFAHPIIRVTVHNAIDPVERALLHYRAATLLHDRGSPAATVGVHLLLSPGGLDATMLDVLRHAAEDAVGIGAPGTAAEVLRRLARELPPGVDRDQTLIQLGVTAGLAGLPDADEHLTCVIEHHPDGGPLHDHATLELARIDQLRGRPADAVARLERLIASDTVDPATREAARHDLLSIRYTSRAARALLGDRFAGLRDPGGPATSVAESAMIGLVAFDQAVAGELPHSTVIDIARRSLAFPTTPDDPASRPGVIWLGAAATTLMWCDELDEAFDARTRLVDDARASGAVVALSMDSALRAEVEWRRGDIAGAELDARQAIDLANELPAPHPLVSTAVACIGLVALELTDDPLDLGAIEQEMLDVPQDPDAISVRAVLHARGLLRAAAGDIGGSISLLREAGEICAAAGIDNPSVLPWRSSLARALALAGHHDEATTLANDELTRAHHFGAPRAIGIALHTLATITTNPQQRLDTLRHAVSTLADSVAHLEHARALIDLGTALRHGHHISEAREHLRNGEHLATRCGATVLARHARHELHASGARPRRSAIEGRDALTPSERRVAELAAAGHTNRTIAQRLFISQKTVETHLSHAYTKLNVQSRHDIARALD